MKGKRFSEERIIGVLRELAGGKPMAEVCRRHGVSEQSIYRWRSKYAGMEVADLRRLKELESENRRLKHVVAEQALDIAMLKEVAGKKW